MHINFNNESNNDVCLDVEEKDFRINDIDARKIIQEVSKCSNATEFQNLLPNDRNEIIVKLKQRGLSIRQISRLTGISKGKVDRL